MATICAITRTNFTLCLIRCFFFLHHYSKKSDGEPKYQLLTEAELQKKGVTFDEEWKRLPCSPHQKREETWTLNEPLPTANSHLGILVFKVSLWHPSNFSIPAFWCLLILVSSHFWVPLNFSILAFWVPPNLRMPTFCYHPNLSFSHFGCLPDLTSIYLKHEVQRLISIGLFKSNKRALNHTLFQWFLIIFSEIKIGKWKLKGGM